MSRSDSGSKPVCKYGAKCFRKNPQHFIDFLHPETPTSPSPSRDAVPSSSAFCPPCRPRPAAPSTDHPYSASSEVPPPAPPPGPPPPTESMKSSFSSFSRVPPPGRKCKFGCGRDANRDERRVYDTCCRRCGVCQGAGEHDRTCAGGASEGDRTATGSATRSDAMALSAIDYALELRRRSRAAEESGDSRAARSLLDDAAEQLELARAKMPNKSKLAHLLEKALQAFREANPLEDFEAEVDAELDQVVAELEEALAAAKARPAAKAKPAAGRRQEEASTALVPVGAPKGAGKGDAPGTTLAVKCKFGCGRIANPSKDGGRAFDTCCRACGKCGGTGKHDKQCDRDNGVAVPSSALASFSTALVAFTGKIGGSRKRASSKGSKTTAGASSGADSSAGSSAGSSDGGAGKKSEAPPAGAWGESPAQEALRILGLDDAWPTDLTMREIRRRYMREALKWHPDKGSDDEKENRTVKFQELASAYATLEAAMAVLERIRGGGDGGGGAADSSGDGGEAASGYGTSAKAPSSYGASASCKAADPALNSSGGALALEDARLAVTDTNS